MLLMKTQNKFFFNVMTKVVKVNKKILAIAKFDYVKIGPITIVVDVFDKKREAQVYLF